MAPSTNDQAPWQQQDRAAATADEPREEPVWTGLLPAVAPAGPPAEEQPGDERSRASSGPVDASGPVASDPEDEDDDARRRTALRQQAVADEPRFPRLQQVFLAVVLPLVLLGLAVRVVATPLFLWLEYHRPGFPADPQGFTTDERMVFGSYGLDYVLNWAPPGFLGGLEDADGAQLFLSSEVAHMTDVKIVLQVALTVVLVLGLLAVLSALYLRAKAPRAASGALFFGSWLTVVLLVLLAVAAVLGWQQFFALFHSLFFADGTWTFRATDTLIRLYPTQFWMDAAIAVGVLALLGALAVMAATWPTAFRRHRALDRVRRRQELKRRLAGR
ncbi:hypothetical protein GCM10011374_01860 [Kocuria dechangensis]|uniref:TIGR01906 family membrane protein n=1 Tax=Kocuria dechangensis TaxID=1176249 RepID=A0A917LLX0_9MICC|nr:TIGR01906 family membrane protein [Kocuria dechangensis]GGG43100.1 hypothetical protein GCM10011374_01860 [Kocuria dechangensis]